jgi:hypothetical protein
MFRVVITTVLLFARDLAQDAAPASEVDLGVAGIAAAGLRLAARRVMSGRGNRPFPDRPGGCAGATA